MDQRVLVKLDELNQLYTELHDTLPKTLDEYLKSKIIRRAIERLIQITIECVIDICSILVKELQLGVPHIDEDIFLKLEDVVYDQDTIDVLRNMKRFRNRIVHRYSALNDEQIYSLTKILLPDVSSFIQKTREFIQMNN